MQKMSPIPSFAIALEIRAGRIPVQWTVREAKVEELLNIDGQVLTPGGVERVFWPEVETNKFGDAVVSDLEDALDLRAVLFRSLNTRWSERTALEFLKKVGAWRVEPGEPREQRWEGTEGNYATVAFRHRFALGVRVLPVTLDALRLEAKYWYDLLSTSAKMQKAFGAAPSPDARPGDHFAFATDAHFYNTLPVSLEGHGARPRAVIEPVSACELLAAAAWADVAGGLEIQVCARCLTRFKWPRKRIYCPGACAHQVASRDYKRRVAALKRAQMAKAT